LLTFVAKTLKPSIAVPETAGSSEKPAAWFTATDAALQLVAEPLVFVTDSATDRKDPA
jgi:hypothetical protein